MERCVDRCQCSKFKLPCLELPGVFPSVFSLTWRTWGCGGLTALGMPGREQLLSGRPWMALLGPWAASPLMTAWAPAGSPACLSGWLPQYYRLVVLNSLFLVIMRLHIFLNIYRPFGFTVLWSACIFMLVFKNLFIDSFYMFRTQVLCLLYIFPLSLPTLSCSFTDTVDFFSFFFFFLSFEWREVIFYFLAAPHDLWNLSSPTRAWTLAFGIEIAES